MIINKVNYYLALLIALSFSSGLLALYLLLNTHAILLGLCNIILCLFLIRKIYLHITKSQQSFLLFLQAIQHNDFSLRIRNKHTHDINYKVTDLFNKTLERFQKSHQLDTERLLLFQLIIQKINIGILLFNENDSIEVINSSANRILNIPGLHQLSQVEEKYRDIAKLSSTTSSQIILTINDLQVKVEHHPVRLGKYQYRLYVLNNIHSELESQELKSWKKLSHVLIHEIGNSVTPISSLANTIDMLLKNQISPILPMGCTEFMDDLHHSTQTIVKRSKGLTRFINEYRELIDIPIPRKSFYKVSTLLDEVCSLYKDDFEEHLIILTCSITPLDITINVDKDQITQVMINLIVNAIHSFQQSENKRMLIIRAMINDYSRAMIEIEDNGCGMSTEVLSKIFTPFFTTKLKGSGIGLSICRQIMHKHNGAIHVNSTVAKGSCIRLIF